MILHIEHHGSADPHPPHLILLHGWAMHSGVMAPLVEALSRHYRVHCIDLPGHGLSPDIETDQADISNDTLHTIWLRSLMETIDSIEEIPKRCYWAGWSLGARLALQLCCEHTERCSGLVSLASTPQFLQDEHWKHGMPQADFLAFQQRTRANPQRAIKRFIQLMSKGCERSETRRLIRLLEIRNHASATGLAQGLRLLQHLGIRQLGEGIPAGFPHLALFGHDDPLAPAPASDASYKPAHPEQQFLWSGHLGWFTDAETVGDTCHRFFASNSAA